MSSYAECLKSVLENDEVYIIPALNFYLVLSWKPAIFVTIMFCKKKINIRRDFMQFLKQNK
jgi:hypothetical protein